MSMLSSLLENLGNIAPSGYGQMDWKETPKAHIFLVDLPGLTKNEVKLEIHQGRVLHISCCREEEEEAEEKGEKWHCRERISGGSFSRQFRLPEDARVDDIKASMQDGVLVVTVPKDETRKKKHSKKAMVEISGDDDDGAPPHTPKGLGSFLCCKA